MKISKGIELPKTTKGAPRKFPFDQMEIGDSFDIPVDEESTTINSVYISASRLGMTASVRKIEDEGVYRVWRVR